MFFTATDNVTYNLTHIRQIFVRDNASNSSDASSGGAAAYANSLWAVVATFGDSPEQVVLAYGDSSEKASKFLDELVKQLGGYVFESKNPPAWEFD